MKKCVLLLKKKFKTPFDKLNILVLLMNKRPLTVKMRKYTQKKNYKFPETEQKHFLMSNSAVLEVYLHEKFFGPVLNSLRIEQNNLKT